MVKKIGIYQNELMSALKEVSDENQVIRVPDPTRIAVMYTYTVHGDGITFVRWNGGLGCIRDFIGPEAYFKTADDHMKFRSYEELEDAGFTAAQIESLKNEVCYYLDVVDDKGLRHELVPDSSNFTSALVKKAAGCGKLPDFVEPVYGYIISFMLGYATSLSFICKGKGEDALTVTDVAGADYECIRKDALVANAIEAIRKANPTAYVERWEVSSDNSTIHIGIGNLRGRKNGKTFIPSLTIRLSDYGDCRDSITASMMFGGYTPRTTETIGMDELENIPHLLFWIEEVRNNILSISEEECGTMKTEVLRMCRQIGMNEKVTGSYAFTQYLALLDESPCSKADVVCEMLRIPSMLPVLTKNHKVPSYLKEKVEKAMRGLFNVIASIA